MDDIYELFDKTLCKDKYYNIPHLLGREYTLVVYPVYRVDGSEIVHKVDLYRLYDGDIPIDEHPFWYLLDKYAYIEDIIIKENFEHELRNYIFKIQLEEMIKEKGIKEKRKKLWKIKKIGSYRLQKD